jgi:hypothetical protein
MRTSSIRHRLSGHLGQCRLALLLWRNIICCSGATSSWLTTELLLLLLIAAAGDIGMCVATSLT